MIKLATSFGSAYLCRYSHFRVDPLHDKPTQSLAIILLISSGNPRFEWIRADGDKPLLKIFFPDGGDPDVAILKKKVFQLSNDDDNDDTDCNYDGILKNATG